MLSIRQEQFFRIGPADVVRDNASRNPTPTHRPRAAGTRRARLAKHDHVLDALVTILCKKREMHGKEDAAIIEL